MFKRNATLNWRSLKGFLLYMVIQVNTFVLKKKSMLRVYVRIERYFNDTTGNNRAIYFYLYFLTTNVLYNCFGLELHQWPRWRHSLKNPVM